MELKEIIISLEQLNNQKFGIFFKDTKEVNEFRKIISDLNLNKNRNKIRLSELKKIKNHWLTLLNFCSTNNFGWFFYDGYGNASWGSGSWEYHTKKEMKIVQMFKFHKLMREKKLENL